MLGCFSFFCKWRQWTGWQAPIFFKSWPRMFAVIMRASHCSVVRIMPGCWVLIPCRSGNSGQAPHLCKDTEGVMSLPISFCFFWTWRSLIIMSVCGLLVFSILVYSIYCIVCPQVCSQWVLDSTEAVLYHRFVFVFSIYGVPRLSWGVEIYFSGDGCEFLLLWMI